MSPRAQRVKSEGQSIDQPVLSTTFLGDTIQEVPLADEETSNGIPEQGNLMLTIEGGRGRKKSLDRVIPLQQEREGCSRGIKSSEHGRRDRRSICITKGPGKCC